MDGKPRGKKKNPWVTKFGRKFLVGQEANTEPKAEVLSFQVFEGTRKYPSLERESI